MPNINELRQSLMDTLKDLRDPDKPMEVGRAKAIAQVAGVIVDTARVEIDFLKVTGGDRSEFIGSPQDVTQDLPKGIVGIRQHRIKG